jgi:hypothetical protein
VIGASSTLTEVAYAVCTALDHARFTAVLTGGSAATFYAPEAYLSDDLDFVLALRGTNGESVLKQLGYERRGDFYVHPSSRFSLEFPPGPLAIGDDLIRTWSTFRRRGEVLHVLTPTDSCRDRLASFLFWNDFRGLEQALYVYRAQRRKVDLESIRAWCTRERQPEKFELFEHRARAKPSSKSSARPRRRR